MMWMVFVGMAALVVPRSTPAREPPPPVPRTMLAGSSVLNNAVHGIVMGKFHVVFGVTKLRDVGIQLSNVLIRHSSESEEAVNWLCFTSETKDSAYRFWIFSDDEYGGSDDLVTGIYGTSIKTPINDDIDCPSVSPQYQHVVLDNGLWIGSPLERVRHGLSDKAVNAEGWWRYTYSGTESLDVRGTPHDFDVSSWVDVRMLHGSVAAIRATKILSD